MKKINIHIADDHKIMIDGIKAVLKTDSSIQVVGESLNGIQVIDWYKTNTSDVLILDINMPELDGLDVLRGLKGKKRSPKIIVLSSYDDIKLIREVLKMGASGFLAKNCAGESIIEAIKTVFSGEQYFSESVKKRIYSDFTGQPSGVDVVPEGTFYNELTNRETDVLRLIANEMSSKAIALALSISVNTVETHRKNLIKKLNVKNVVGLALYAVKHNIV